MKTEDITDPVFREAVDAIDTGDVAALRLVLDAHPELVTTRLKTPKEKGYFKDPYLLWFVADNPIRHPRLPDNIVEITRVLLQVLQQRKARHYQKQVDYALGLVSTGRIPKECGVQITLMDLLISEGAKVKGSVLGVIGHQNFEAARYLLSKGSDYDLATAVGLGNGEDAALLAAAASPSQKYVALMVASFFGNDDMIRMLLDCGADPNGKGEKEDFGGFHSHASALHQAVYSGSFASVQLLVEAGASLNATDKGYNGTPLDWAMHMRAEEAETGQQREQFAAIADYLAR